MSIAQSLYEAQDICLAPMDPEKDAEIEARWSQNAAYLHLLDTAPAVPEYNQAALGLFIKAGFVEEVRCRQALQRDGRRWDLLLLGFLSKDWEALAKNGSN